MQKPKKGPLPPQEQMSDEELIRLLESDTEADWQKINASVDAWLDAMSEEERAAFDRSMLELEWNIAKLLKAHGRNVFH